MRISKERYKYLRDNYPIDTSYDLHFFDDYDKWFDDVKQQRNEDGKYTITYLQYSDIGIVLTFFFKIFNDYPLSVGWRNRLRPLGDRLK